MSLIARFVPELHLREVDRVAVGASCDEAYAALRRLDLHRIRFARWLFALRTLPERVSARLHGEQRPLKPTATIDDIVAPGNGFVLLEEEPGEGFVVGSIGKFWEKQIEWRIVPPSEFAEFEEPGWGKLAFALEVAPRVGGGSWITCELRVTATDAASLDRFRTYWALIGRFSHAIRRAALDMLVRELGLAPDESTRALDGDELMPGATYQRTDGVTIDAPPDHVWPWIVQMGGQRAGWYSHDLFDHGGRPSADHIVPELQKLQLGQIVAALPEGKDGFAVLDIDRGRAVVLGSPALLPDGGPTPEKPPPPWRTTWAFVIDPVGDDACRLVVRVRVMFEESARGAIAGALVDPIHGFMEAEQLRNLKRNAEATP